MKTKAVMAFQRYLCAATRQSWTTAATQNIAISGTRLVLEDMSKRLSEASTARLCHQYAQEQVVRLFSAITTIRIFQRQKPYVVSCSAVPRMAVRVRASSMRARITSPRMRLRPSALAYALYRKAHSPWLGWAKHSNIKHLLQTIIPKDYASIL